MRITHICLCGPYTDGLSYQDNLLPKYQKRLGHDITVIAGGWAYNSEGKLYISDKHDYINEDGIRVIRLHCINTKKRSTVFKVFSGVEKSIKETNPDFIFIHGVQFLELLRVTRYAEKNGIVTVADNHADYSNSGRNFLSKYILHGVIWRFIIALCDHRIKHYYGVLPARVDFLKDRYGLSASKISYLPMGADDDKVNQVEKELKSRSLREKLGLSNDDFVIVTGGKIDSAKRQVLDLMRAVNNFNDSSVRLIVFGSVQENLKEEFNHLLDDARIKYQGWVNDLQAYSYFSIADLICFPGRHSVYWEQCVALKKPLLCKYWDGTTHVDIGGNVMFLMEDSEHEIRTKLNVIINQKEVYDKMKAVASNPKAESFLYSNIAKKSLEYMPY